MAVGAEKVKPLEKLHAKEQHHDAHNGHQCYLYFVSEKLHICSSLECYFFLLNSLMASLVFTFLPFLKATTKASGYSAASRLRSAEIS